MMIAALGVGTGSISSRVLASALLSGSSCPWCVCHAIYIYLAVLYVIMMEVMAIMTITFEFSLLRL